MPRRKFHYTHLTYDPSWPACGVWLPRSPHNHKDIPFLLGPPMRDKFLKLPKEEQCQTCLRIAFAKPRSLSEMVDQAEHFQATLDSKTALRRVIAMLRDARAAQTGELAIEEAKDAS